VKFKDAELLGMPFVVRVGRRLADGVVELEDRRTGEVAEVAVGGTTTGAVLAAVRGEHVGDHSGTLPGGSPGGPS